MHFFGVARKRDLVFIAIGELHVGLAWDIRVIPFGGKSPRISRRSGLASGLDKAEQGQLINLQRNGQYVLLSFLLTECNKPRSA
jgi:hypothetical protein